jgi:cysteine desulfurase
VPEIAASNGSACHSGSESPCASLVAIGVGPTKAVGPVRLSFGRDTTVQDVEQAAERLASQWKRLTARPLFQA